MFLSFLQLSYVFLKNCLPELSCSKLLSQKSNLVVFLYSVCNVLIEKKGLICIEALSVGCQCPTV